VLAWMSVPLAFMAYALTPLFFITPPKARASNTSEPTSRRP
jgi:hypothetical protein